MVLSGSLELLFPILWPKSQSFSFSALLDIFLFFNTYLAEPGLSCGTWIFSCSILDLVPCPGIKLGPFCIGGLSHWTTRKVPLLDISHYVSESSNKRRGKGKRRADLLHIFVTRAPVVREKGSPSQLPVSAWPPLLSLCCHS